MNALKVLLPRLIMEVRDTFCKVKRVVIWLRCGYTFSQKARAGYDLEQK